MPLVEFNGILIEYIFTKRFAKKFEKFIAIIDIIVPVKKMG